MALSANGQLLASGGQDGTVRIFDANAAGAPPRTLRTESRYARMNITGLTGISDAQREALLTLGAVEQHARVDEPTAPLPR